VGGNGTLCKSRKAGFNARQTLYAPNGTKNAGGRASGTFRDGQETFSRWIAGRFQAESANSERSGTLPSGRLSGKNRFD